LFPLKIGCIRIILQLQAAEVNLVGKIFLILPVWLALSATFDIQLNQSVYSESFGTAQSLEIFFSVAAFSLSEEV